tara:strand:- start:1157 stop:4090 length:2934 start_codon:yes stop_codon:yes gene_type:complete
MLYDLGSLSKTTLYVEKCELTYAEGLPGERIFHYNVECSFDVPTVLEKEATQLKIYASLTQPPVPRDKPNFSPKGFATQTMNAEVYRSGAENSFAQNSIASQTYSIGGQVPQHTNPSGNDGQQSQYGQGTSQSSQTPIEATIPAHERIPGAGITDVRTIHQETVAQGSSRGPKMTPHDWSKGLSGQARQTLGEQARAIAKLEESKEQARGGGYSKIMEMLREDDLQNEYQQQRQRQSQATGLSRAQEKRLAEAMMRAGMDPAQLHKIPPSQIPHPYEAANVVIQPTPDVEQQDGANQAAAEEVIIETSLRKYTFPLKVYEDRLGATTKFYLVAELSQAGTNMITASSTAVVDHLEEVDDYITPKLPPEISVAPASQADPYTGTTYGYRVEVRQVDMNATKVQVFRRVHSFSDTPRVGYSTIIDADLDVNDGTISFFDDIGAGSYDRVIYRAAAIGSNGQSAQDMAGGTWAQPSFWLNGVANSAQDLEPNPEATVSLVKQSTVAEVYASNLPAKARGFGIRKYRLSSRDAMDARRGLISGWTWLEKKPTFVPWPHSSRDKWKFLDKDIEPGHWYAYQVVAFTDSSDIEGPKEVVQVPSDAGNRSIVQLALTNFQEDFLDDKGNILAQPIVSFTLGGSLTTYGFEKVSSVLNNSIVAGLFDGDINNSRELFGDVIQYEVLRDNLATGETESFGIYSAGNFSDNESSRKSMNVQSMLPGTTYRYKVTALVRHPASLFEGLTTTKVDAETLQIYQEETAKYLHPLTAEGTLPAPGWGSQEPFSQARTTSTAQFNAIVPQVSLTLSNVEAVPSWSKRKAKIGWGIGGDSSTVDHYRVYKSSVVGNKELIGTVQTLPGQTRCQYVANFASLPITNGVYFTIQAVDLQMQTITTATSNTVAAPVSVLIPKHAASRTFVNVRASSNANTRIQERSGQSVPSLAAALQAATGEQQSPSRKVRSRRKTTRERSKNWKPRVSKTKRED